MAHTTLKLYKENFKFSAAHFMIFDAKCAERLHGHNYQVCVDIGVPSYEDSKATGYSIDFNVLKKFIREELARLDEIVLLPQLQTEMKLEQKGPSLHVHFRDRYYVFPTNEVCLLPLNNTSVEALSFYLADLFKKEFSRYPIHFVEVSIEETSGQSASTRL